MDYISQSFSKRRWLVSPALSAAVASGLIRHDAPECLRLSDVHWVTPDEVANAGRGVPIAWTARRDKWCFYAEAQEAAEPEIIFVPRVGKGPIRYAPNFEAFLFRLLLEEMSSTWTVVEPEMPVSAVEQELRSYVEKTRSVLRPEWSRYLQFVAGHKLQSWRDGTHGFVDPDQAVSKLREASEFNQMDEPFPAKVDF